MHCPDCGTYWRVWVKSRIAKPSAEWNASDHLSSNFRYRRAPLRDIDHIIEGVRLKLPEIIVRQHEGTWPTDDDGIWGFYLSHVRHNIQLESSPGMCPFLVENDSTPVRRDASTIEEGIQMVVEYLREEAAKEHGRSIE
jgi:hypothetical protein